MTRKDALRDLMRTLARLGSEETHRRFMVDLCTPAELEAMASRWQVARLVAAGVPYRKINEQTGVSTATVTRVARCLMHGEGGYRLALGKKKR